MPENRENLTAALRRLIVAHPDVTPDRSREAKAAYEKHLDYFAELWAERFQTTESPHR